MSKIADEAPEGASMQEKNRDLGFGTRLYRPGIRLVNPDGSFNVIKRGRNWFRPYDFYHNLKRMSWPRFIGLIFLAYLLVNMLFSFCYLLVGLDNLEGTVGDTPFMEFLDAFFFSAQTITTLGYGRISPVGTPASIIAAIESLLGLLGFALATGLIYGRFSQPQARIKFSEVALIAPYRGISGFMFRIANERSSELVEVEVQVTYARTDPESNRRRFTKLELELSKINFLSLSWTIVHPINEESPIWGMGKAELEAVDAEFIIMIKGFDDSFSSTVYQRSSYKYWDLVCNAKFSGIVQPSVEDKVEIDLARIGEYEELGSSGEK